MGVEYRALWYYLYNGGWCYTKLPEMVITSIKSERVHIDIVVTSKLFNSVISLPLNQSALWVSETDLYLFSLSLSLSHTHTHTHTYWEWGYHVVLPGSFCLCRRNHLNFLRGREEEEETICWATFSPCWDSSLRGRVLNTLLKCWIMNCISPHICTHTQDRKSVV